MLSIACIPKWSCTGSKLAIGHHLFAGSFDDPFSESVLSHALLGEHNQGENLMLSYVIHKSAIHPIFVDTGRLRSIRSHQASRAMITRHICPIPSLPGNCARCRAVEHRFWRSGLPPAFFSRFVSIYHFVPSKANVMISLIRLVHLRTPSVPLRLLK